MDALLQLQLVCALGAGYENIDLAHARGCGIALANGAGTNDDCVADHAFGLLIATVRGIVQLDARTREGVWRTALPLPPNVSHKRLGILGLGTIGRKIAQRALGFEMEVGYCNRSPKGDLPYRYFDSLQALAAWCDVLVIATPGGPGTRHLVDADILQALGERGWLVNIARGSVVDTAALALALRTPRHRRCRPRRVRERARTARRTHRSVQRGAHAACCRLVARGGAELGGPLHRERHAPLRRAAHGVADLIRF